LINLLKIGGLTVRSLTLLNDVIKSTHVIVKILNRNFLQRKDGISMGLLGPESQKKIGLECSVVCFG